MNVIVFGATGMIGSGVLLECLRDPQIDAVLTVGRTGTALKHAKLRELVHDNFLDYDTIRDRLAGHGACFFCLGVSSAGMSESAYHRITHDVTVAAAEALLAVNPQLTFCYVSGAGTDSTEKGRVMWARVKGRTENRLLAMPMRTYMFRPGFIQPVKGVRSKTRLYRVFYGLTGPFLPLLRSLFPRQITTSENLGRAMIRAVLDGHPHPILQTADINALAGAASRDAA